MVKVKGKVHWLTAALAAHLASGFVGEALHEMLVETSILPVMHVVERVVVRAESMIIGGAE